MSAGLTRRSFVKTTAITGAGIIGLGIHHLFAFPDQQQAASLYLLSQSLLKDWLNALLELQITDKISKAEYGGILCPTKKIIHGRVGDTIYPMLFMADKTGDEKFLDSARLLYHWMETNVSQPDGSWLNEPKKGSWKGTTVFAAITLAEAIKKHGHLIDSSWKHEMENRLKKAGDYIYDTFSIEYGNINYPINAAYGLFLLGELLDISKFSEKGHLFAHQALKAITNDGFIAGEGALYNETSKKGCYAVDLGYNVEESLPALVMYGLLTKDEEVLQAVTRSLQTHMELMLPDGGWDNSWGTRNYKWTYWGSRTSDGCQPAYALLADRDPRFYKVALLNTQLLQKSTVGGLLYGGPHYISAGIKPSVHHTFCHAKALTVILDSNLQQHIFNADRVLIPREESNYWRFFKDIQTWLIAKGGYKATVTGYDQEYKNTKNGHATGGAITMLWHEKAGPVITASMNEYQLFEADNMQADQGVSMPLTPRIELQTEDNLYMNICDLTANIEVQHFADYTVVNVQSKLVNKNQEHPPGGEVRCELSYIFRKDKVILKYKVNQDNDKIKLVFPVISCSTEKYIKTDKDLDIFKAHVTLRISSNHKFNLLAASEKRVFNFVPGLEAIPLIFDSPNATVEIKVI